MAGAGPAVPEDDELRQGRLLLRGAHTHQHLQPPLPSEIRRNQVFVWKDGMNILVIKELSKWHYKGLQKSQGYGIVFFSEKSTLLETIFQAISSQISALKLT